MEKQQSRSNNVRNIPVAEVMATDIVSVDPADTVSEALELMLQNHVSALPVVNGRGSCVGVISATDILSLTQELEDELLALSKAKDYMRERVAERLANSEMATERVQEVMTRDVVRIKPGATLADAAATMVRHHVHRVMVIDDEQRLVGIVSTMDVMRSLATNKS